MNPPKICRYCGGMVVLTSTSEIYQKSRVGKIYLCRSCNAYVSTQPGTSRPLGTLANAALRLKRRETHRIFDAFWSAQGMNRDQAYRWMAKAMNIPYRDAHIGLFEMEDCELLCSKCREARDAVKETQKAG